MRPGNFAVVSRADVAIEATPATLQSGKITGVEVNR
jgi:hypothetical protein